jgi:arginase family enzyme
MGLAKSGITILHFDETYLMQGKLQNYTHEDIDLQQLQHTNLMCEEESLAVMESLLQNRSQKGIIFIGSGNYHYVSYLLLKEVTKPFTLVLFDNHSDLGTEQDQADHLLSCGSWVSYALKEVPLLQKVVIIGPTSILPHHFTHPRVVLFPFDGRHQYSVKSILSVIHTQNVYISIDKDVLNTTEAVTNWDQGGMNMETLSHYLDYILEHKQAEGIDICGEDHLSPIGAIIPDGHMAIQKNENANIRILQKCLERGDKKNRKVLLAN